MRSLLFVGFFLFAGCIDENGWYKDSSRGGGCGTVDTNPRKALVVEAPSIFKAQCAACHSYQGNATGPKMRGILDRVPSEEWLQNFITHQDSLVAVSDSVALKIMEWSPIKWGHNYSDLEKHDLDTLMSYITQ